MNFSQNLGSNMVAAQISVSNEPLQRLRKLGYDIGMQYSLAFLVDKHAYLWISFKI